MESPKLPKAQPLGGKLPLSSFSTTVLIAVAFPIVGRSTAKLRCARAREARSAGSRNHDLILLRVGTFLFSFSFRPIDCCRYLIVFIACGATGLDTLRLKSGRSFFRSGRLEAVRGFLPEPLVWPKANILSRELI